MNMNEYQANSKVGEECMLEGAKYAGASMIISYFDSEDKERFSFREIQ